jgi:hypothetical protein
MSATGFCVFFANSVALSFASNLGVMPRITVRQRAAARRLVLLFILSSSFLQSG